MILSHLNILQVPEYLARVDRRLKEESDRLLHYLDPSTRYEAAFGMPFLCNSISIIADSSLFLLDIV